MSWPHGGSQRGRDAQGAARQGRQPCHGARPGRAQGLGKPGSRRQGGDRRELPARRGLMPHPRARRAPAGRGRQPQRVLPCRGVGAGARQGRDRTRSTSRCSPAWGCRCSGSSCARSGASGSTSRWCRAPSSTRPSPTWSAAWRRTRPRRISCRARRTSAATLRSSTGRRRGSGRRSRWSRLPAPQRWATQTRSDRRARVHQRAGHRYQRFGPTRSGPPPSRRFSRRPGLGAAAGQPRDGVDTHPHRDVRRGSGRRSGLGGRSAGRAGHRPCAGWRLSWRSRGRHSSRWPPTRWAS